MKYNISTKRSAEQKRSFTFSELSPYQGLNPYQSAVSVPDTASAKGKHTSANAAGKEADGTKSILMIASDILRNSFVCKFLDSLIGSARHAITGSWALANIREDVKERLRKLKDAGRLKLIKGEDEDSFLTFIRRNAALFKFTVVTNCVKLQMDLAILSRELKSHSICISEVADGELAPPGSVSKRQKPIFEPVSSTLADVSDAPIKMKGHLPHAGNKVRTDSGELLTLDKPVSVPGGEADVYCTRSDRSRLIKVYRRDTNTPLRFEKIKILIQKRDEFMLRDPNIASRIAFPLEIVYNKYSDPVGFTMPNFFDMKPLEGKNIAKMLSTRKQVIDLALSVCELAKFAADNNLYLADVLSGGNILFNDRSEAFLIDLDSAQFTYGGKTYRTDVGKIEYLSPEKISGNRFDFIRTKADDAWSLSLLIFEMLVLIHENPYFTKRKKGTAVNAEFRKDVLKGRYCFVSGSKTAEIIKHLPIFIRTSFYDSFNCNGNAFTENKRFSADHWLMSLLNYKNEINQGRLSDIEMQLIPIPNVG